MEVFNVLATMNLVDMMSSPLNKINNAVSTTTDKVSSMSDVIGNANTKAMLPLAVAAGAVVAALGSCVAKAIEFESSMADVAKVVNFTSETELKGMQSTILDMSTKIPMAADGIAAIIASAAQSGIAKDNLAEFAEQAAKMGVAFDLTGDQAGKMMADWKAGMGLTLQQTYELADAVNHLSNKMNAKAPALGEVLQRAGSLGMVAGLAEAEVAALGAAFLSGGTSPEIAATSLKNFTSALTLGTAMTEKQALAFKSLGYDAEELAKRMQVDAKGAITDVLKALSEVPEYKRTATLTEMFGKDSLETIAPLLKNIKLLPQAFDLVADKSTYLGSMQAEFEARSKTVANAVQLLQNKLSKLGIVAGTYLLPIVAVMITAFGGAVDVLTWFTETSLGKFFVETAGAVSLAAAAVSAFFLAVKIGGVILPFIANGLTALKTAFLGLALPVQGLIIMIGLLYTAYKLNLGGMADKINAFYQKAKLVFQGVAALFASFKDGTASITGDLAKQIKDAGLEKTVASLFKIFRRLQAFVTGVFDGISMSFMLVREIFGTVFQAIGYIVGKFIDLLSALGMTAADTGNIFKTDTVKSVGAVIGIIISAVTAVKLITAAKKAWLFVSLRVGAALKTLAVNFLYQSIRALAVGFGILSKAALFSANALKILGTALKFVGTNPLILGLTALIGIITLVVWHFDTIKEVVGNAFSAAWEYISVFAVNLVNYWKSLGNLLIAPFSFAFETIKTIFSGLWDFIDGIFSGKSLFESGAALINTFKEGILSAWDGLKESFTDVLSSLRELLPFSDAKKGPLSTLTLSGNRLITTIGEGASQAAPAFIKNINGVFSQITPALGSSSYTPDFINPLVTPSLDTSAFDNSIKSYVQYDPTAAADYNSGKEKISSAAPSGTSSNITVNIENISLPNVQNASDFMIQLENELLAYGEQ